MSTRTDRPRAPPPRWLNALMRTLLRTPIVQRLVGRSTALLTFTGRRSGTIYTTPVSYTRRGDRVIVTGHESRRWWRNLTARPRVELRLAGKTHAGEARVLRGDEALADFVDFVAGQRLLARAMGVRLGEDGLPDPVQARAALADTVVVVVRLDAPPPSG